MEKEEKICLHQVAETFSHPSTAHLLEPFLWPNSTPSPRESKVVMQWRCSDSKKNNTVSVREAAFRTFIADFPRRSRSRYEKVCFKIQPQCLPQLFAVCLSVSLSLTFSPNYPCPPPLINATLASTIAQPKAPAKTELGGIKSILLRLCGGRHAGAAAAVSEVKSVTLTSLVFG